MTIFKKIVVKSRRLDESESSFKEALTLAESVEDQVAQDVIQTQLAQINSFNQSKASAEEKPPIPEPEPEISPPAAEEAYEEAAEVDAATESKQVLEETENDEDKPSDTESTPPEE